MGNHDSKSSFSIAEPEDVVNATLFLLSDKSSMLNGVILPVDGGISAML